jgi:uncharacterized protein (TIGR03083 family)
VTTVLAQSEVIDALAGEYSAVATLAASLTDDEWDAVTPCPAWDVRAAVSHMIGTESTLAGLDPPPDIPAGHDVAHVRNPVGEANERWVVALATLPGRALVDRFRTITSQRLASLQQMDQAAWDAEGSTPAGPDTYGRFMRIRVFDCWMHEQDIRDAIGRPGHDTGREVELTLDEMTTAMGFVVGKKAGAPTGSTITFDLTGPAARQIHLRVGPRAELIDHLDDPATVTLQMPALVFTRLGGGRLTATDATHDVTITGDTDLGKQILNNLAYTI